MKIFKDWCTFYGFCWSVGMTGAMMLPDIAADIGGFLGLYSFPMLIAFTIGHIVYHRKDDTDEKIDG